MIAAYEEDFVPEVQVYAGRPSEPNVVTLEDWDRTGAVWLGPEDVSRFSRFVPRQDITGLDYTSDHYPAGFAADRFLDWMWAEFGVNLEEVQSPAQVREFAEKLAVWLCNNPEGTASIEGVDTGIPVEAIRSLQFFTEISVRQNLWWRPVEPEYIPDWD